MTFHHRRPSYTDLVRHGTMKYEAIDNVVKLRLKIMQWVRPDLKEDARIVCKKRINIIINCRCSTK